MAASTHSHQNKGTTRSLKGKENDFKRYIEEDTSPLTNHHGWRDKTAKRKSCKRKGSLGHHSCKTAKIPYTV